MQLIKKLGRAAGAVAAGVKGAARATGRFLKDNAVKLLAGATNVQFVLTVTDTRTGKVRVYLNPQGATAAVNDADAFGGCP